VTDAGSAVHAAAATARLGKILIFTFPFYPPRKFEPGSDIPRDGGPDRARLHRMQVDILDTLDRFSGKTRRIIIIDILILRVQEIQSLDPEVQRALAKPRVIVPNGARVLNCGFCEREVGT
jgi:hypothetical protein